MSLPEVLLWQQLRRRAAGLKFRRQHPIGRYVVDFCCAQARLAVEIDGDAHSRGDRPERDARRYGDLAAVGLNLIRVPAPDVLKDAVAVVEAIVAAALPLHQPAAGPPPQALLGEELAGAC